MGNGMGEAGEGIIEIGKKMGEVGEEMSEVGEEMMSSSSSDLAQAICTYAVTNKHSDLSDIEGVSNQRLRI